MSGYLLKKLLMLGLLATIASCDTEQSEQLSGQSSLVISRAQYGQQLEGFWLGQNIANWTGLITEMDKIGTPETMPFYTDADWGGPDQKAFWGDYVPHADIIDFYFEPLGQPWGADDDTDLEYMYLHLHHSHGTSKLSAEQIRQGWLKHIYSETDAPLYQKFPYSEPRRENFLWVSNERARLLMEQGAAPPETSEPHNNPNYRMIDAQLTTEIFGLLAPARVDVALDIAELPIRTTAKYDAQWIAQFYVVMHSLAAQVNQSLSLQEQTQWLAQQASRQLPEGSVAAKIYAFVWAHYLSNPDRDNWELTRDAVYQRYQLDTADGYSYEQPFDAAINFAASLVSLFYGEGDIVRTLRIGTLAGWDSDNPTATWGGLLGFLLGAEAVQTAFGQGNLSSSYWIHRTRRNFPDYLQLQAGEDSFPLMAARALRVIDLVVVEQMNGSIDRANDQWVIPIPTP
ncbi:MAG: ADP-ribosylglycohydrolase family protein [Porticoccaceae bacterium]|jgi:hypothetical protein|nr:ADP-ribosylglycohydrolase family protein [Porticoccaceae bacterium]